MSRITRKVKASSGIALIAVLLLVAAMIAAGGAFYGWLIMLAFGIVHGSISDAVPAVGFLPCWGLGAILAVLTGGSSD